MEITKNTPLSFVSRKISIEIFDKFAREKFKIFLFFCICFHFFETSAQIGFKEKKWVLQWNDEFDFFDDSIWKVAEHFDHYGEPQIYLKENVSTINGNLVIDVKKEDYTCPKNKESKWFCSRQKETGVGYAYTSGFLQTKSEFSVQYGLIEARIKIPIGNGFFPALWVFGNMFYYQEIDIFEMLPGSKTRHSKSKKSNAFQDENIMTSNLHLKFPDKENFNKAYIYKENFISDYTKWHVYSLEWTPKVIKIYVDGKCVRKEKNLGIHYPLNILINCALQSKMDGQFREFDFPAQMLVDYVRVYQPVKPYKQKCK